MDPEIQRALLEELNTHDLDFLVSGRQVAEQRGIDFADVVTAANELERKSRIGHYKITVINETDQMDNIVDVLISITKLEKLREKHDLTLRIGGNQNFSTEQFAAIESMQRQYESLGYAFHMPRVITASVSMSAFEVVMLYIGMKAVDKATDRVLDKVADEVTEVASKTVKRLHQLCRNRFENRQRTTIIVINEDTKEEIRRVEIEDDEE